ncbi:MAG: penicillin-binding protein activator [Rhodospirillales bacterium]|nr:penicillin-binding protein activator [Rhodospirillales bacterium]
MTASYLNPFYFRALPWPLAVLLPMLLFVAGCQTSNIASWGQEESVQATRPPSEATRRPVAKAPAAVRQPEQLFNPVPEYPFPTSLPSSSTPSSPASSLPGPAPEQAALVPPQGAGEPGQPPPSFLKLLTRPPQDAKPVEALRSSVPAPTSGDIVRVALLLPLTGANAKLGQAMLNAAQLAVFDFAGKKFELLTHDTKGTPAGAVRAAQLAIGDGAAMLLGPLLSASTRAVSAAARAANVPVVAFSSDRSVAGGGTYTLGFLPSAEINRIVFFAASKGVRRFAVLAPDSVYGETIVNAYEGAVAAQGGILTQVQFYDPFASDFSKAVRSLANYGARRETLLEQRKKLEGKEDEVSQRALKRLDRLQTIGELPFEALLVADGGKRLQSIAALLPFYDIDPKKVRMLGTGQWDVPGIGAEPALIGGWYAAPSPTARGDFEAAYKGVYGKAPPRLATLAYDATALAAVLARAEGGPDFSAKAITVPSGFWGRDGIFRLLPNGLAQRGLAVMKVGRRGGEVISRAPETFQAASR